MAGTDGAGVTLDATKQKKTPKRDPTSAGPAAPAVRIVRHCGDLVARCPTPDDPLQLPGGALPGPGQPAVPGAPAGVVTIADVERYLPDVAELIPEPKGWAVVRVPANFMTRVEPVVVDGELLGEPAEVRFTPLRYRWNYGDGTTKTTATPGASWADLGLEELSTTATSHLYRAKGDLRASVTVYWTAEYRFAGGDWIPIDGIVAGDSPEQRVLVVTERTVLTNG